MKPTKTIGLCTLAVLSCLVADTTRSIAQTNQLQPAQQPSETGRAGARPAGLGSAARVNIDQRVERLTQMLNLTPEQQSKLRLILEGEQKKVLELRTNAAVPPRERMIKMREIREETNNEIREILAAEQKQRFDRMRRPEIAPGGGPEARFNIDQRVQRLAQALSLTQEQQTKLRAVLEQERSKLQQLRADATLGPEERRAKMRELGRDTNNKIHEILTPDQREKFDAMPRAQLLGLSAPEGGTNQPVGPRGPRGPRAGRPGRPVATR